MKKPLGMCTVVIAPTIIQINPNADNRVKKPTINPSEPNDSPMIIKNAIIQGNPAVWVK